MAYCGAEKTSCAQFSPSTNDKVWFKIQQVGLLEGAIGYRKGKWALAELIARNYTWTTTIPERIESGAYLLRHELIALHVPFIPEFYMQCAEVFVEREMGSGKGGVVGEELKVGIPGVWKQDGELEPIPCYP